MCGEQGSSFGIVIQGFVTVNMDMAVSICKNLELTALALHLPSYSHHFRSYLLGQLVLCVGVPGLVVREKYFIWLPKANLFLGN